jgi:hypothetical protein
MRKSAMANRYMQNCEVLVGGEVLKVELVRRANGHYDLICGIGLVVKVSYPKMLYRKPKVG